MRGPGSLRQIVEGTTTEFLRQIGRHPMNVVAPFCTNVEVYRSAARVAWAGEDGRRAIE